MSKAENSKCANAVFAEIIKHLKKDAKLDVPGSRGNECRWIKRVHLDRATCDMVVEFHDGTRISVIVTA